jgi:hypothetical protein
VQNESSTNVVTNIAILLAEVQRQFKTVMDIGRNQWLDDKQKEYYDKVLEPLSTEMQQAINELHSISHQLRSIEAQNH